MGLQVRPSPENVTQLLEAAVAESPEKSFLVTEDQTLTYAEFWHLSMKAARVWHDLGVCHGDRVAFFSENRSEFLWAWMGLARIGGVLVALNTQWRSAEIDHLLELVEPRLTLVSSNLMSHFGINRPGVSTILLRSSSEGEPVSESEDFGRLIEQASPIYEDSPQPGDDALTFISTSGTTGRPKAVVQTHRNFVLTGEGYAHWVGLQSHERMYLCLPLFHINSQAYTFMGAIAARASIALVEKFSASRFWSDMKRFDVDVFNYVGSMMAILQKREPSPGERDHHVRITYGGPALSAESRLDTESRFGITIISGIGMSENTFGLIEDYRGERRGGSLGKPRQHPSHEFLNEARAVDDEGKEVSTGTVGELVFRNPVLMKGYFREPEQTASAIRAGWLHTGDLVRIDDEGFFYFVDRKKDVIRVRGENVSSLEVEETLMEHPAVLEAAVIAVPGELAEDDVAAFVVLKGDDRGEELREWCGSRLARFKVPKHVWIMEILPKTETQRVQKQTLRRIAEQRLAEEQV